MDNPEVWENKKINSKIRTKKLHHSKMPHLFANLQSGSDLWMTTPKIVKILLPYLKKYKNSIIWCPFDTKKSNFVKILKKNNFNVVFSHLEQKKDFFKYTPKKWDIIVSNPPWSIKDKVLKRAISFNKPFALILPIHSLSGKFRWSLFRGGDLQLLISKDRMCFEHTTNNKHNRPPFESAYFCWKLLPKQINYEK